MAKSSHNQFNCLIAVRLAVVCLVVGLFSTSTKAWSPSPSIACYPINRVPDNDRLGQFVKGWILEITGSIRYNPSIDICPVDDKNVFATLKEDHFVLLYGRPMFGPLMAAPRTNWEAIALLSHEVGHIVLHFQEYSHPEGVSRKEIELEADEFSGFILAKLGVPWETLHVFEKYGDYAFDSPEHHGTPAERRHAAAVGWKKEKIGLSYDAKFVPYVDDAYYVVVHYQDNLGLISTIIGLVGTFFGVATWGLHRFRKHASH